MKKIYAVLSFVFLFTLTVKSQVVINEVYGGGGNSGSTYTNDFIELYNNGSSLVSLVGWSVQYASATGTSWAVTVLSGSIPAGGHYLIQEAVGAGGTTPLPSPDATGSIALSATAGKVALVSSTTALTGTCPTGGAIVDFVGFGATANCSESAPTPAPANATAVQRNPEGFDSGHNNTDFVVQAPTPTNAGGGADTTPPSIASLFPVNNATGVITAFTATVTFSETVQKGAAGTITIKKVSDNSIAETVDITSATVVVSGSAVSFEVNSLAFNTNYYVEISAGSFKDLSSNAFAGITGSSAWNFTTSANPPAGAIGTNYSFNTCGTTLPDGFVQYSILGDQKWACSAFGIDGAHSGGGSAANGLEINGFLVTNIPNEDWLITPAFDISGTTFPLLSFWSRTKFNGLPLQLKISTNYPGTGDPRNYTWTDINGKFPSETTDTWTLSSNIDLSAFKSTKTFVAFVYSSSSDDGARWTLDEIQLVNSASAPPPTLTLSATDIQFGYAAPGNNSDQSFVVTGNDISGDITLTASSNFSLSASSGGPFTSSITLLQASANNTPVTVYARFSPAQSGRNFTGSITVSTAGVADTLVNLAGTSIDPANTLEVVNWNLEWFGSTSLGPTNDAQQQANVETILQNIGADIYGLVEVVDTARLGAIVRDMPGYSYVVCNYGSHANPFESGASPITEVQKEAFVYKTSMLSNITTAPLVTNGVNTAADLSNPAYNYFASGRYPFMMKADVTLNGITKTIRFVLLHAKANTSPTATSYARRKSGADTLKYTLNNLYPNENIFILGDINDDLDSTITDGINPKITSYYAFTNDTVTTFMSPTLQLSLAGKKSTVSYNDVIDHVILSRSMRPYYMNNTASVLNDVSSLVSNYGNTTSDHYPVFTRYAFDPSEIPLPIQLLSFNAVKQGSATTKITWTTTEEINSLEFRVERSTNGSTWQTIAIVPAAGTSRDLTNYSAYDPNPAKGINLYRLKSVDRDNKFDYSAVRRVNFDNTFTYTIYPNPAHDEIDITVDNSSAVNSDMQVCNAQSQVLLQKKLSGGGQPFKIDISSFAPGVYFLKIVAPDGSLNVQKFIKQ